MKITSNFMTGIIGFALSVAYILASMSIPRPPGLTQDLLGSRSFPIAVGVLLCICSIIIAFLPETAEDAEEKAGKEGYLRSLPYVIIVALYILILPYLGAIIATTAAIFAMMNRMERNIWWKDLLLSATISIILWLLFDVMLKVSLPSGILG